MIVTAIGVCSVVMAIAVLVYLTFAQDTDIWRMRWMLATAMVGYIISGITVMGGSLPALYERPEVVAVQVILNIGLKLVIIVLASCGLIREVIRRYRHEQKQSHTDAP